MYQGTNYRDSAFPTTDTSQFTYLAYRKEDMKVRLTDVDFFNGARGKVLDRLARGRLDFL